MDRKNFLFLYLFFSLMSSCSFLDSLKDREGPTVEILHPQDKAKISTSGLPFELIISGSAEDVSGVALVKVSINGGGFADASGQSSWTYQALLNRLDLYQIDVFAVDQKGNVGLTKRIEISLVSNL